MRPERIVAAVAALLVLVVAGTSWGSPASAQEARGPSIFLDHQQVNLGDAIIVSLQDFTSQSVTVAVCGNLAKRGSQDCNMPLAQSERIRDNTSVTLTQLFVQAPPAPCPCLVRAASATTDEFAVAPITILNHPSGPVVELEDRALIEVGVDAVRGGRGVLSALRTSLGGPTTYRVTVTVRNVTTEQLVNIRVSGSAEHVLGDAIPLELGAVGPLAPGQTWEQVVEAEVPAPVIGGFAWDVVASGAGPAVTTSAAVRNMPWTLVVLLLVFVVDVIAIAFRRGARRRREDEEAAADADELDDEDDGGETHPQPSAAVHPVLT